MQLTLISGWSGITELYPTIAKQSNFLTPFWHHSTAEISTAIAQGGDTLIGWSTGAHLILKEIDKVGQNFSKIILLAPFLSFSHCFHPRIIKRMQQRLVKHPQATITDFWQKCGIEHTCPVISTNEITILEQGLEFLATSTAKPNKIAAGQVTLVRSTEDQIVTPKEFKAVATALGQAEIIDVNCQHQLPEQELLQMVKHVTGTSLI